MPITLFDRYIAGQILRPLAIALCVALLAFLVSRFLQLMDLVLGASGPIKVMFEIIGYLVPHYLSIALPISLLFGVMFGFNKMTRDGEVDAMQAAGLSLARQLRPAMAVAIAVMAINTVMESYLRPYARYAYQQVVYAVSKAALHASVRAGVFARVGNVTFLIQGIGPDGVSLSRVFLYESDGEGESASAVAAKGGDLIRAEEDGPPILRLFEGLRISRHVGGAEPGGQSSALRFRELRTVLHEEHAMMFRPRGAHEREMTIVELWRQKDHPPAGLRASDLVAEFNSRVARVLSIPLMPVLGLYLALGRGRSDRLVGFAVGLIILIAYERVLDFGKNAVESGLVGPLTGLWLPYFVFATGSLLLFARAVLVVPHTPALGGRRWWERAASVLGERLKRSRRRP
ncbi:putative Lipopolysaccharide export system permease protein [Candidatus Defluviicoccus seviourii]|uniref:Lipopolysaccharide export system permease protein n=1 Tax=Candidatus Defluviicoccus seviourii TaxID=2565273 RepID=A0A564WFF0_9PROT|nr:putative Lipopolysaccharide export system permease protein [Candidatus Defluviicoccus seviourii]